MKRNKELFYEIADHILRHPDAYDQGSYGDPVPLDDRSPYRYGHEDESISTDDLYACHTRACVAGWACLLSDTSRKNYMDVIDLPRFVAKEAQELLGLTEPEAENLFAQWWMEGEPIDEVASELRRIGDGGDVL